MKRPPIVIVGFGRVGGAIALGLQRAGWPVSVRPRSAASKKRAAKWKLPLATAVRAADVCLLTVPDDAVTAVARDMGRPMSLVHCSGALTLDALPGRSRGSFHPLVAVATPETPLHGGTVAIAATDVGLRGTLLELARALDLSAIDVPEGGRAAYHAGAVMSAGLVVTLLEAAVEASGLPPDQIRPAYRHLAMTALHGKGLTGPVVRGDAEVVKRHLAALPAELRALYRTLSKRMLALARLEPAVRSRLAAALDVAGPDK